MKIFKQKILWAGVAIVLVVLMVFGLAMMGSVISAKPKNIPVVLVNADQPVQLPGGQALAVGELIQKQLTTNDKLPLQWSVANSEAEARSGLDDGTYYGALILPADLSGGIASLSGTEPKPATVTVISNDGLNVQAATAVKQGLDQAMRMVNAQMSAALLGQIGKTSGGVIPVTAAQALLAPIQVADESVHPVGLNNASGNAPGLVTQIMWMGSLASALVLFQAGRNAAKAGSSRMVSVAVQALAGTVITGLAAGFIVWMASGWYGMEILNQTDVWLVLWLAGLMFFLLQSALLNWLGMSALPLLILLMFFSMPLLNMAPEFLSNVSHDWLYSWTPLRFAALGLRKTMYFGGLDAASESTAVLWAIGGACLLTLLAAGFKKGKAATVQVEMAQVLPEA
ncbi:YhgE/Pip domain-containing protein [Paenibacillus sp. NFR01]|uniref:YhgE/Pip domain-containing protein n=1 Tax=Paenibacillus sp. NFR01 TaxID=1566279 RepID=UPI0008ADFA11|nr:ABC transporter permease [Paenibacillus sp. NFR01]SET86958.1 YhgE/Pip N-terminal domain-containing protein [Paenibacillus sp. NFR01]